VLLENRIAIVTGAGRGIGQCIASALAAERACVVLAARTAHELADTERQIRSEGGICQAMLCDLSEARDVDRLVQSTLSSFGKIDILVNNAGIQGPIGPLVENDEEEWLKTLQVNLIGPLRCMRRVLAGMIERRSGKIINLSGGGATAPRVHFSAYGASKTALVRLTETVAEEVRPFNIQVNAIAPGAVNTRMLQEILDAGSAAGAELEAARARQSQGGTSPELAARLAVFLASDASGELTGKLISAPHDDWQHWSQSDLNQLMDKPWLTLRRMDPFTLGHFSDELSSKSAETSADR
jgi:3-oxoacyl-[acyl-carrier protein] reductase